MDALPVLSGYPVDPPSRCPRAPASSSAEPCWPADAPSAGGSFGCPAVVAVICLTMTP